MKNLLLLPIIMMLMVACSGGDQQTETVGGTQKAEEMAARISVMEDSLSQHLGVNRRSAQTLLDVYKGYVSAYPLEARSPDYLFRASRVALAMREPQQSLKLYDRIIADYPSWDDLPNVYFMKAFVLDDHMKQKGEAEVAYKEVISSYPDHPLAEQARVAIENLHYTDEQLIEKFQRMQAEQEAAVAN